MHRFVCSGLVVIENAAALEPDPELASWAWYAGAYQQYHTIIFLLIELHLTPGVQEADRIGVMANYVFGASSRLSVRQRSGEILHLIEDNCN